MVESVISDGRHDNEQSDHPELFESLLGLSDLLVVALDGDGTIQLFNRSCETLTGYSADEMVGRSIWSFPLIPDDERPGILRAIANVRAGVSDFRHVNHWVTRNGERRLIHWRNTILRHESGRIDRLFASGIDVTEQQRAIRAHRHQRREMHRLLDAFPALVARLDKNLHIRFANHGYREWFDLDPVAQVGRHVADVIGTKAFEVLEPHFRTALSGEESVYHGTVPYRRGGERFIHGTYVSSHDQAGQVDGLHLLAVDITRERRLHWQLIEQEQRSKTIIDNSLDGIICIDPDGWIISCNPAAERIFGYSSEEMTGKNVSMLMPSQTGERHDDFIRTYLATGRHGVVGNRREVVARHRDGRKLELLIAVAEVVDREHYFVGFLHDISQQKRAEREARRHLAELAHATRVGALGEVAAGLAHELSQPLTAIGANAETCLMRVNAGGASDPVLEPALSQIRDQSRRAGEIIDYLRRFLRKEEVNDREECMPEELVDRVLMLLHHELHSIGVRVRREIDPTLPCRANRVQIEQVLFNLTKNAVDALEGVDGKRELQIRCHMSSGRDAWEMVVADNGPGLRPEYLQRLFHPFFTTKSDGLGQGLSICRSIVERHGGVMEAANRPEGGMVFRFSLPLDGGGHE